MSGLPFAVLHEFVDGTLRFTVSGELDLGGEPQLVDAVDVAMNETSSPTAVVVDTTALTFIDSSGLRALLLARKRVEKDGVPFALAVAEGPVTRLLDLSGVRSRFSYE